MVTVTAENGMRALLADGRVVRLRALRPDDEAEVLDLHERLSERDRYLRFFGPAPPNLRDVVGRMVRAADAAHAGLGAYRDGVLVGVATYEVLPDPTAAEIALVVDGAAQAHGVGTLLLEHLASVARRAGVRRFVAEVLAENYRMLRVFAGAGLPCRTSGGWPQRHVEIALDVGDRYLDAIGERERVADIASLTTLLRPRSVAVIGAGRRASSIGHAVLVNLRDSGYTGRLYAVNPHAHRVAGVPCVACPQLLPEPPDLAVVCVPAPAVPEVVEQCGWRRARAVAVISAGLSGSELGGRVVAAVRRYGMRLVGPNCIGVANTDPAVRLNATFARGTVPAGAVGVVTQSGGVGIALLESLRQLGLGVSTLVSTGDKYDVSGNDLLLWWRCDPGTRIAVLYLESFGNPRKFARFARALARAKPVLAVRAAGSSDVAQRVAASYTAAPAAPAVTRDALYQQAGVIAVDTVRELVDLVAALSWQPLPAGNRVAVLSNAGGTGVLAADACVHSGLTVTGLAAATSSALRALLPATASVANPVDTTAVVAADTFGTCLEALLGDEGVDAVIVAGVPTALGDPLAEVARRAGHPTKPVLVVRPGQLATVAALRDPETRTTTASYADPAQPAAILGRISGYAAWRRGPHGSTPDLPGIAVPEAVALVQAHLAAEPAGGWLEPGKTWDLLNCFGIPAVLSVTARTDTDAVAALHDLGGSVAVKAIADRMPHKSAADGVLLHVRDEAGMHAAIGTLRHRFGAALRGVQIQPMIPPGRELIVGLSADAVFGTLLLFGLGGTDTELIADRATHLIPLSNMDAERMIHSLRCAPLLFGPDARPRLPEDAIIDVLLRVSRLAEVLPEVAELALNPVVSTTEGCLVLDARIRVRPRPPVDPFLRRLRA